VDTDRDRDIALIEVQEENRLLIEEFMREKLGKRGEAQDAGRGSGQSGLGEAGAVPGQAAYT
jgi:hypothetical protein